MFHFLIDAVIEALQEDVPVRSNFDDGVAVMLGEG